MTEPAGIKLVAIPMWLRLWLALQVIYFVVDPLIAPDRGPLLRSLIWTMLMMLLGWAMWRRSRGAWLAAVAFAVWAVLASVLTLLTWPRGPLTQYFMWFGFGLVIGLAEMAVLLSGPARRWVDEAAEDVVSAHEPDAVSR